MNLDKIPFRCKSILGVEVIYTPTKSSMSNYGYFITDITDIDIYGFVLTVDIAKIVNGKFSEKIKDVRWDEVELYASESMLDLCSIQSFINSVMREKI